MKSGGISLSTALTIIFIVLKLCNVIAWSWWWVLSPLWISFAIGILILISFIWAVIAIGSQA